ncbi:uncharacterized protein TNIN_416702 [Trichonephila inaurata madagascariensis]|uniref:Uncharacterized protein n=1 Tax=Trichonephila inaurata madagascariensis TaxID=2747483 RepID=A0A8X6YSR9_9ARAC|nr:uncharacterized protein TNIN_416702 [Trichonephila inaurata madagascariensis]
MTEVSVDKKDWFNSYVDQSVTFSSWRKVEAKICQILKQNVEKKLMDPIHRQILFQILGDDFVNKYFSSYTNSPAVLDNIRLGEKEKKTEEMKTFVATVISNALQKNGPKSDVKVQSDLSAFSEDLQNAVGADLQEELADAKSKKKQKVDMHEKYLSGVLASEPYVMEDLISKMSSQLVVLSDNLRHQFWPICSSAKEKTKNKKNSDKVLEKFAQLYRRLCSSPDLNEDLKPIMPSVYKVYNETKCLEPLKSEENMKSCAIILKICDSYGRKFQSYFVYYAIVVQQQFLNNRQKNYDQDCAYAAFFLDQILRLCAPNSNRCVKIVKKVCEILPEMDKQLHFHIKEKLSVKSNSEKDDKGGTKFDVGKPTNMDNIEMFLNTWISSGFAAILKSNLLFFIWDQLLLNKWENKILQDICLTLLGLLKPWFMVAKNQNDIHKVFMEEPSLLYFLDVRNALLHVQKKKDFLEVPRLNRNVKYSTSEPVPAPPTPPPSPKIETPPKPVIIPKPPIPLPVAPPKPVKPPQKFIPWVPYNKEKMKDMTSVKNKVDLPFDFYIDSVRLVPDNATVVKITGKVLNMYLNQKDKSIKFQVYPELDSFWRYPKFNFKQAVNLESIPMNPDVVIMLRVYTVEHHSKNVCVLGSCLFGPFSNKHGKQAALRVGGHQIRVRHGIPDPDFNVEHMLASHMDDNPIIPGLTILIRVLPHSKESIPPSEYETNCYRSDLAKPNESENKLYKHYQDSDDFSMTVRDKALLLIGQASANDPTLKQLIQQQFPKEGSDVEDFPYQRYVHYNPKEHGMMVLVDKAAGLPLFLEGRYLQCLAQVFPGEDTKMGSGKNQVISFVTNELELDSSQRAPDWSDQPTNVKPEYDDRAFILLSLYGLRPRFNTDTKKLLDREGREPRFNLQQAIAWSAMPCFDKGAVYAGIHQVPLLKCRPPDDILEKLSYLPLDYICKKFKSQLKVFEAASIEVSIWDGHFSNSECPPLPVHTQFLNISNNPSRYLKAAEHTSGATAAELLKSGLSDPYQFNTYKKKILELLTLAFKNNLDNSLAKSGYPAMI